MSKTALIVHGGWDGHQPGAVGGIFARVLREENFSVTVSGSLAAFDDAERVASYDLIVPVWTMGTITAGQCRNVTAAVAAGCGLAGCHGGMCDSFRDAVEWHWMTGGQWVAHPGNDSVTYTVNVKTDADPITAGVDDFTVTSEQYLMHVDPSNRVLATTAFPTADGPHATNGTFEMPVVWTRRHGRGRVFYDSIGHDAATVAAEPNLTLMRRGFLWAAR